jgi:hypothetical protein
MQLAERLPDVLGALWRATDIYQHAMHIVDAAQQHVIVAYLDTVWQNVLGNSSSRANGTEGFTAAEIDAVRRIVREHEKRVALFHVLSGGGSGRVMPRISRKPDETTPLPDSDHTASHNDNAAAVATNTGRKLLQQTNEMSTIDTYTSLVASSKGFSDLAVASFKRSSDSGVPLVTETWLEGPFGWPPK